MYKKVVSKFSLVVLSSLMILYSCNNLSTFNNTPQKITKSTISTVNPMKIVLKDNKFKTKSNDLISVKSYKNILVGGVLFESINVFRTPSSEDTFVITLVTSSNQEFKPYLFQFKGSPCNSGVHQEINDDSSEVDVYYVANGRYSIIINNEAIADEIIMNNPQTIDLSMSEDEDYVTFNVNAQGNDHWKITLTGPETSLESTCNRGLFNQGHRIKKKSYSTTDTLYVTKKGTYTFTMSSQFRDLSVSKTFEILEDAKNECDCGNQSNVNTFGVKRIFICPPCVSPTPTPEPTPSPDPCDENAPPLLPENINNLLQKLDQYLSPNALSPLTGKVNNFTNNVNKANNLAGQYGFSTQATKEEKAKVKYDAFVEQINQGKQELLTESANLKTVASNILNEVKNTSNINKQLLSKETDFNGYKLKVEELVEEFNYLVTDENTYSLAEASAVYGQEVGLLAEIIEDYANRVLPVKVSNEEELEQYQDDETGFEKIQTTKGLIRYLKARIEGHKTKLDKLSTKLSNELESLKTKFVVEKEEFYQSLNELETEAEELELILEQLNNDLEDTFTTQGFKVKNEKNNPKGIEILHSAMEKKQKRIEENRQWLRDNIPLAGALVDQILDPTNLIPFPQVKAAKTTKAIASPLFDKFFGPLAKQTWESLGGKKGYAYATEGFNKASDSLFSMGSKGKKFDKAIKPVQNTSNKVTDIIKDPKCIKYSGKAGEYLKKIKISPVFPDWVTKGAHVTLKNMGGKEVTLLSDGKNIFVNNGLGNKKINETTNNAVKEIKNALSDNKWVEKLKENINKSLKSLNEPNWNVSDKEGAKQRLDNMLNSLNSLDINSVKLGGKIGTIP